MVTKEILLAIIKERNLQTRTTLPFGTLSPHYQTLKDQTFLKGLQALLRGHKRTIRSKSPSPVFIPSPAPLGGTGGLTIVTKEPPLPQIIPVPLNLPPLIDPSPFVPMSTYPSPPLAEPPRIASPPLPLVPWGSHQREYSSMEQYKPPVPMDETPDPVNISLPLSLPISIPVTQQTESIPLPPVRRTAPSSLDLIPLPWDMPSFPRTINQLSPPVTSSLQFPLIVSMTPSHTTPLLPKNPLTEDEPPANKPMPPEWKRVQSLPVTGK